MVIRFGRSLLDHVVLFVCGYFCLQVLVRLLTTPGLVIDESEQMLLTQSFALGYNAQPPLYTWIQILFFRVFGPGILALALLKNLLLALAYLFTYLAGCRLTDNRRTAALAALSLLLLPQIVGEAQVDQIHSVLVTTAAAATLYLLVRLLQDGGTVLFLWIGVTVAAGILAKYNFVLMAVALLLSSCLIPEYRRILLRPPLVLTVLTAVLLVAPHAFWVLSHPDLASAETLERMQLHQSSGYLANVWRGTVDLLVATLAFVGPFLGVCLLVHRSPQSFRLNPQARLLGGFIALSLLLIFLVILATETTQIKQRWLQPFLFAFPLLFFLVRPPAEPLQRRTALIATLAAATGLVVTAVIPLRIYLVDTFDEPRRDNYPFRALAQTINAEGFAEGLIITEDKFIGGNMRLFFPDATVITPSLPLQPYQLAPQLLVVWQHIDPVTMIDQKSLDAYRCRSYRVELPFRHSQTLSYQVRYRICRQKEGSGTAGD